jgi:hypothetical protein
MIEFITYLFYCIAIFPILWEIVVVTNINKVHSFILSFKSINDKNKINDKHLVFSLFMYGYLIWIFIGFFTSQWILLSLIFLLGLIPKPNIYFRWLNGLITMFILIFIIINKYHLNLDILKIISY